MRAAPERIVPPLTVIHRTALSRGSAYKSRKGLLTRAIEQSGKSAAYGAGEIPPREGVAQAVHAEAWNLRQGAGR
jgi:hypothetical protein